MMVFDQLLFSVNEALGGFLWIPLGLMATLISTALPLIQEKRKADGFAVAVWMKIVAAIATLPILIWVGFPSNPYFFLMAFLSACLWAISDVIYFKSAPIVGAGIITRLIPTSVLLTFVLWFFFEPSLLIQYLSKPLWAAVMAAAIIGASLSAFFLKKCTLSWQGFRMIWFVIFAACAGTILDKLTLNMSNRTSLPFVFIFTQACFMLALWGLWGIVKKPLSVQEFLSRNNRITGLSIGALATVTLILKMFALKLTDHPAFLSVLLFTDAVWVLLYYKITKRKEDSNVIAGLGIVVCALVLIVAKSHYQ
jgi:hypothetical protein